MSKKSSIVLLQEICSIYKRSSPRYVWLVEDQYTQSCKLTAMEVVAYGRGRSKRDAKHEAATIAVEELCKIYTYLEEYRLRANWTKSTKKAGAIEALRNYCICYDHPLPTIDVITQKTSPRPKQYVAVCVVASIRRFGSAEKRRTAQENAASDMLYVISKRIETLGDNVRLGPFLKTCKITAHINNMITRLQLSEDVNLFQKYVDEIKAEALRICTTNHASVYEQALNLLRALKVVPVVITVPGHSNKDLTYIEIKSSYNIVFVGFIPNIYTQIIEYFKYMVE